MHLFPLESFLKNCDYWVKNMIIKIICIVREYNLAVLFKGRCGQII